MELENHFRACKSGLHAQLIVSKDGDSAPMMQVIEQLFDLARRQGENLGDNALLAALARSLVSHNGAELQRDAWRQQHSCKSVIRFLVDNIGLNTATKIQGAV